MGSRNRPQDMDNAYIFYGPTLVKNSLGLSDLDSLVLPLSEYERTDSISDRTIERFY